MSQLATEITKDANSVVTELQVLRSDITVCLRRLETGREAESSQQYLVAAQSDLQALGDLVQQLTSAGLQHVLAHPDSKLEAAVNRLENEFLSCCQQVSLLHQELVSQISNTVEIKQNEPIISPVTNANRIVPVTIIQEQAFSKSQEISPFVSPQLSNSVRPQNHSNTEDFVSDLPELCLHYSSSLLSQRSSCQPSSDSGASSTDTLGSCSTSSSSGVFTSTPRRLHPLPRWLSSPGVEVRLQVLDRPSATDSSQSDLSSTSSVESLNVDSSVSETGLPRCAFSAPDIRYRSSLRDLLISSQERSERKVYLESTSNSSGNVSIEGEQCPEQVRHSFRLSKKIVDPAQREALVQCKRKILDEGPRELSEQEEAEFFADEQYLLRSGTDLSSLKVIYECDYESSCLHFENSINTLKSKNLKDIPLEGLNSDSLKLHPDYYRGDSLNFSVDSLNCLTPSVDRLASVKIPFDSAPSSTRAENEASFRALEASSDISPGKALTEAQFIFENYSENNCNLDPLKVLATSPQIITFSQTKLVESDTEKMDHLSVEPRISKRGNASLQNSSDLLIEKTVDTEMGQRRERDSMSPAEDRCSETQRKPEMWAELHSDFKALLEDKLVVQTCESTERSLEAADSGLASASYLEFVHELQDLSTWLQQQLQTLQRQAASRSEKYLNQSYHEDLLARSRRLQMLQKGGQQLVKRYPALQQKVLQLLDTLQQQWEAVELLTASENCNSPQQMLEDLGEDMIALRDWLREMEMRLEPLTAERSLTADELQLLLNEHQSLQSDVEARSQFVSAVLRLCDRLQADNRCGNAAERQELRETAANLEERWQTIWLQALERQYLLERLLGAGGKVGLTRTVSIERAPAHFSVGVGSESLCSSNVSLGPPRAGPRSLGGRSQCSDSRGLPRALSYDTRSELSDYDTLPFHAWEYQKIEDSGSEWDLGSERLGADGADKRLRAEGSDRSDEGIDTLPTELELVDRITREPGDGGYSSVGSSEEPSARKRSKTDVMQKESTNYYHVASVDIESDSRACSEMSESPRCEEGQVVEVETKLMKRDIVQEITCTVSDVNDKKEITRDGSSDSETELKSIIDSLIVQPSSEEEGPLAHSSGSLKSMVDAALSEHSLEQSIECLRETDSVDGSMPRSVQDSLNSLKDPLQCGLANSEQQLAGSVQGRRQRSTGMRKRVKRKQKLGKLSVGSSELLQQGYGPESSDNCEDRSFDESEERTASSSSVAELYQRSTRYDFAPFMPSSASDAGLNTTQMSPVRDPKRSLSFPSAPQTSQEAEMEDSLDDVNSETYSAVYGEVSEDQRSLAAFSENAWDNLQEAPYSLEGCTEPLEPRLEWQQDDTMEPEAWDLEAELCKMRLLQERAKARQQALIDGPDDSDSDVDDVRHVISESDKQLRIVKRFLDSQKRDGSTLLGLDPQNYTEVQATCQTNVDCLRVIGDQLSAAPGSLPEAEVKQISELRDLWNALELRAQKQHEAALRLQQLTHELRVLRAQPRPLSPVQDVDEEALQQALLQTQRELTEVSWRDQQLQPLRDRLAALSSALLPDTDLGEQRRDMDGLQEDLRTKHAQLSERLTLLQGRLASWREFRLMVSELRSRLQNDRHHLQDLTEQQTSFTRSTVLLSDNSSSAYSSGEESDSLKQELGSLQKTLSAHEARISSLTQLAASLTSHSSPLTRDTVQTEVTQIGNEIRLLQKQIVRLWAQLSEAERQRQLEVAEADLLEEVSTELSVEELFTEEKDMAALASPPAPLTSCWFHRLLLLLLPLLLLLTLTVAFWQSRPFISSLLTPSFRWVGGPPPT